ncbi:g4970 [Coccomyxa elongata]
MAFTGHIGSSSAFRKRCFGYCYGAQMASGFLEKQVPVSCAVPVWFSSLLSSEFFDPCEDHYGLRKNECTFFCKDCCSSGICMHCLPAHPHEHTAIQIRKYMYQYVVRIQDIQEHFDTSGVQTYIINSARVVFLRDRKNASPAKDAVTEGCLTCKRALRDNFYFCSLSCKVEALHKGIMKISICRPNRQQMYRLAKLLKRPCPASKWSHRRFSLKEMGLLRESHDVDMASVCQALCLATA